MAEQTHSKFFVKPLTNPVRDVCVMANRKCDPDSELKLFNDSAMEVDMVKLISEGAEAAMSVSRAKRDVYVVSPKPGVPSSVEVKVWSDGEPFDGSEPAPRVVWSCPYCALTLASLEQAQAHVNSCVVGRPELVHEDVSSCLDRVVVDDRDIDSSVLISECGENLGETIVTCDEATDTGFTNSNCNMERDEIPVIAKYWDIYWKCSICGLEMPNSLGIHLLEHSKQELVAALVRSSVALYRPVNGSSKEQDHNEQINFQSANTNNNSPAINLVSSSTFTEDDVKIENKPAFKTPSVSRYSEKGTVIKILQPGMKPPVLSPKRGTHRAGTTGRGGTQGRRLKRPHTSVAASVRHQDNDATPRQWSSRTPHPCPVCGKVLSSRGNVAKHLLLHSAAKPWNCNACGLGFNSARDWQHHEQQNHSGERTHTCPVCAKSFAVRDNLREHMMFHGQRSKACDVCGKMFWTGKCVTRHRKRHFPDKKHLCSLCPKAFAIKWDYTLHCRKVHGIT